jgi:hypothetical protein
MVGSPSRCPHCGSTEIRRSYTRDWTRALLALVSLRPFRCRTCDTRLWRFALPAARPARRPEPVAVAVVARAEA